MSAATNRSEMVLVAQGKAFWTRRALSNIAKGQQCLESGDQEQARVYLERARASHRALAKWEQIEERNIAAGMTPMAPEKGVDQ